MSNEPLTPQQKRAKSVRAAQRLVDQGLAGNQQCQAECYTPARNGAPGPRPCAQRARYVTNSGAALCGNHWESTAWFRDHVVKLRRDLHE